MKRTANGKMRADVIDHVFHFGVPGDVPWLAIGTATVSARSAYSATALDSRYRRRWSLTEKDGLHFGQAGDIPIVGDLDGDGVDEIGVYRDGKWIIDINHNHQIDAQDMVFERSATATSRWWATGMVTASTRSASTKTASPPRCPCRPRENSCTLSVAASKPLAASQSPRVNRHFVEPTGVFLLRGFNREGAADRGRG